jgi:hypothetical protein
MKPYGQNEWLKAQNPKDRIGKVGQRRFISMPPNVLKKEERLFLMRSEGVQLNRN